MVSNVPENYRPSVQTNLLGVNDILEKSQRVLIATIARTPPEHTGKVVA